MNKVIYAVDVTDPKTGARFTADIIWEEKGYTREKYIADCEENADEEWCEMLREGDVAVYEVAEGGKQSI